MEKYAPGVIPREKAEAIVGHLAGETDWVWAQEWYGKAEPVDTPPTAVWVFYGGTKPWMRRSPLAATWDNGRLWLRDREHGEWQEG